MLLSLALCLLCCLSIPAQNPSSKGKAATQATGTGWPTYGGDPGGQRYSASAQITKANVAGLQPAWTYRTGALQAPSLSVSKSDFEATPILFQNTLFLTTPFDRIIALNPETGAEVWVFDPHLDKLLQATNYTSRGVAAWQESASRAQQSESCQSRIFVATLDARLIAVDAANGRPCAGFGTNGQVDLRTGVPTGDTPYLYFGNTSPPTVVGDVVVVGSAIGDNVAVEAEAGVVRGYDARTGAKLWSWDPIPWSASQHPRTSAANAWSIIAADVAHGLVYVPTGAPSPDFYGGLRPGDNRDANSIVALEARTGKKVWAFQLIHHDVWDYDVAAEPLLFEYKGLPAVAIAAKPGSIFVLNRLTGEPLIPVTERPVPQDGVPGEQLSPTQPFSSLPSFNALTFDRNDLTGHTAESAATCQASLHRLRYDGAFTPPTMGGTLQYPGSLGGVNWSSMALDPASGVLYANTNGSAYEIRLQSTPSPLVVTMRKWKLWIKAALALLLAAGLLRWRQAVPVAQVALVAIAVALVIVGIYFKAKAVGFTYTRKHNMVNSPDSVGELSSNRGAPYQIYRRVLQDGDGMPCTPIPWGTTGAIDLNAGTLLWRKPLGTSVPGQHTGTVSFGAPIVTGGDLLFTAASSEALLRAMDKASGDEVWTTPLPVPAQSTPMAYTMNGREYIVVDAGGHGGLGTPLGDYVIAYALPKAQTR